MGNEYRTVLEFGNDEIIIEKSKFIAYVKPVSSEEEAVSFVLEIKKKHFDATHNVSAYIVGNSNEIQRYSDDGEPSGTAGMPILDLLKKEKLTNVAVVVTRYFGGIKLGTGGLVRAYTKSAKIGLEAAKIIKKIELTKIIFKIDYSLLGKIEHEIEKNEWILSSKKYEENVYLEILIEESKIENDLKTFEEWIQNTAQYTKLETAYFNIVDNKVIF